MMMFLGMMQLLPAGPVAQRNRNSPLGGALANDVLIQLGDDLTRSQLLQRDILVFSGSWEINGHRGCNLQLAREP
jgi:hypothetical protein